jgi:hypothetical protein
MKKNRLNQLEFKKKPTGLVRFRFYRRKTEPNPNKKNRKKTQVKLEKKPSQTKLSQTKKNYFLF